MKKPRQVETGHPVFIGKQVDKTFAGSFLAAGGHPSVIPRPFFDHALHWPRLATIEAGLYRDVVPFVTAAGTTEENNVLIFERQSQDGAFAAVLVRWAVKKFVVFLCIDPSLSAVLAAPNDLIAGPNVGAGVVINTSIIQLDESGFRGSEDGEGSTRRPSLTTIVAIKGVTVTLGEVLAILPLVQISAASVIVHRSNEDLRWHQQSALVFAMA